MPVIGVITGVHTEAASLRSLSGHPHSPIIRFSGARPLVAADSVDELLNLGVDGILSFGSAGALKASLGPGDLVVGREVVNASGKSWPCDQVWRGNLEKALGTESTKVFGSDGLVSIKAKARIGSETQASIVDMESHIVAPKAAAAGIPFAVLRSVVDPLDFEIPRWVADSVRPNGTISYLPLISGMCMFPWHIGRLASLGGYNKRAMESLSSAVRVVGPGLGLFTL
jgi:adenosylhomocysteine nucleosidase